MLAYTTHTRAARNTVYPSLSNAQLGIMHDGTSFIEYHLFFVTVKVILLGIRTPVDSVFLFLFQFIYCFVDFHHFYSCSILPDSWQVNKREDR